MSPGVRQGITGGGVGIADLSPDQRSAYDAIVSWATVGTSPVLSLGGVAGSGKSTLTALIGGLPRLHPVAFATFTGKASSVLRSKLRHLNLRSKPYCESEPCPYNEDDVQSYCGTIHSLIYKPRVDANGRVVEWIRRDELDAPYKLLILDEASMIADDLLLELKGFDVPILAVGDHGQLPPVSGTGSMMLDPDLRLEKIHRQAEGNPIIALSRQIREMGRVDRRLAGEHVRFTTERALDSVLAERYRSLTGIENKVTIAYTNRRRVATNLRTRMHLKMAGSPKAREQVVCLKNVSGVPVYNGMRGQLSDFRGRDTHHPWKMKYGVTFEDSTTFDAAMFSQQFNREKTFDSLGDAETAIFASAKKTVRLYDWGSVGHLFDFGYCLTCHKSQGSSFDDVLVICERPSMVSDDDWRKWLYTSVTRASQRVTIMEGGR